jgi:hypothetical protein
MGSLPVPNAVFPVGTRARSKARFNSWDERFSEQQIHG